MLKNNELREIVYVEAFPFHVNAYPAFAKSFQHSFGVKRSQLSPIAVIKSLKDLAPIFRKCAFSLENACSMGLKSGLSGDRYTNQH